MNLISAKDYLKTTAVGVLIMKIRRNNRGRSWKAALKMMERYGYGKLSDHEKKFLFNRMKYCSRKYHFNYQEFFLLNLYNKSDEELYSFVSDSEHIAICEALNKPKNQHIFDDKAATSEHFSDFFGRDTVLFTSMKHVERLKSFLLKNEEIIIKPLSSACGQGVKKVKANNNVDGMVREIINDYCSGVFGGGIAEQIIVQDDRMAKFHPQSVNTVRIPTIRMEDRVEIFNPFFRVGRGDAIVDNGGAGGIICALDSKTGEILAAADEGGGYYEIHPDTGFQLVGFTVPEWNNALELVNKLAMVVPTNRYTGWDLALTAKGWILVEANARGQWLSQIPLQHGFRNEINKYLRELNIEW